MSKLRLYKKLKLSEAVIKRFEPGLGKYYFFNAKKGAFWSCDYSTGIVVSCLDGTLDISEIIDIISANNPDIPKSSIIDKLSETFQFLLEEDFVNVL